jgi:UDP-N-acetylmuramate--alanine ligase
MPASAASEVHLPLPPARAFLVGIGGIGMSGLAQYLQARGYAVAGSDRLLEGPGREDLVGKLRRLGIPVFAQDGSGPRALTPEVLIASAAVEPGNPDFAAVPTVPVCPRARALAALLDRDEGLQIAVAGTAGKTSVTAWLAACLRALGRRVLVVDGGYMLEAESADRPGNFAADPDPEFLVVEVDESDRSLVEFSPHVGVVLNLGTDHYGRDELLGVFGRFLDGCRQACVLPRELAAALAGHGPGRRVCFASGPVADAGVVYPDGYTPGAQGASFRVSGVGVVSSRMFGHHSAVNAAAVAAALQAAGVSVPPGELCRALGAFRGVRQRFEYVGRTARGIPVYADYAHNAAKIAAAIATAREAAGSPLAILFQPHGYGPLGFMREDLRETLRTALLGQDLLLLLPVYYAGGSTSFSPTSAEVATEYAAAGLSVAAVESRQEALARLAACAGAKAVLVMGARDPTLPHFAAQVCEAG